MTAHRLLVLLSLVILIFRCSHHIIGCGPVNIDSLFASSLTCCHCRSNRLDSSHERRSRRSSRPSRSPSRRQKAERRRSSSRHAASHKPSRSTSHRQPESKWTRSQERSTGGAASPAHSDDAYMPFDKVNFILTSFAKKHLHYVCKSSWEIML